MQIYYICPPHMPTKLNWDAIGIGTSLACAIHCALLPVVLTSLPLFGIDLIHNLFFEWAMISLAFFVGSYSLYHGFKKHHQSYKPIIIFAAGFALLLLKQLFRENEIWFLVPAVCLIISAHFYNYRLCHQSKCNSPHHKH